MPRAPKVTIEVTADTIEDSKQRDSSHCMIAEAVRSAFPTATFISVDLQTIRFTDTAKGLRYTYLTPRIAQIGLVDFDAGVTPDPFSFSLRGGQVTKSGRRSADRRRQATAAASEQARAAGAKGLFSQNLGRQALVDRGDSENAVPEKVGGQPPPLGKIKTPGEKAVAFTKRRQFGLRALER